MKIRTDHQDGEFHYNKLVDDMIYIEMSSGAIILP